MAVDLSRIARFAVVDVNGEWGYAPWTGVTGIRIDPGTGTGTFIGEKGTHPIKASDPSATVDPTFKPDTPFNPDAPAFKPDAAT